MKNTLAIKVRQNGKYKTVEIIKKDSHGSRTTHNRDGSYQYLTAVGVDGKKYETTAGKGWREVTAWIEENKKKFAPRARFSVFFENNRDSVQEKIARLEKVLQNEIGTTARISPQQVIEIALTRALPRA